MNPPAKGTVGDLVRRFSTTPTPPNARRYKAKQPVMKERHIIPDHPENEKVTSTEWWQPGADKADPDARMRDLLQRVAMGSGNPRAALLSLLAEVIAGDGASAEQTATAEKTLCAPNGEELTMEELGVRALELKGVAAVRLEAAASVMGCDENPRGAFISLIAEQSALNLRHNLRQVSPDDLMERVREAGATYRGVAHAQGLPTGDERFAALASLICAPEVEQRRQELLAGNHNLPQLAAMGIYVGLVQAELEGALNGPSPKNALLAMAIMRAKSTNGEGFVNTDSAVSVPTESPMVSDRPARPRGRRN
jgi:hypothetical protein